MHISTWKYVIHTVYLLHVVDTCGHPQVGALQRTDTLKYYRNF